MSFRSPVRVRYCEPRVVRPVVREKCFPPSRARFPSPGGVLSGSRIVPCIECVRACVCLCVKCSVPSYHRPNCETHHHPQHQRKHKKENRKQTHSSQKSTATTKRRSIANIKQHKQHAFVCVSVCVCVCVSACIAAAEEIAGNDYEKQR